MDNIDIDKIIEYLKQLDLSDVEAKLYLTLLQAGPTSVRDLAATIDIKRTTAYFYIDQLIEKGLILKLVRGSKKLVAANDPEELKALVEAKISSAKTVQQKFPDILKILNATIPQVSNSDSAEIKYYKGFHGIKKIYEEALKAKEFRTYVNLSELNEILVPNEIDLDINLFKKALTKNKDLQIYEIIADTPESVKKFNLDQTARSDRYHYKFMPNDVGLTSPGILLYDNTVAIINGKGIITCVILYNTEYYTNSKKLFDFIWRMLPENKR